MSRTRHDVVVVGGGVAGLVAAAYVARAGRSVVVLEKEPRVGGLVSSFVRDGFVFDAGLRSIEDSGVVFPMAAQLGLDVEFIRSIVTVGTGRRMLRLESEESMEAYGRFLAELFPECPEDVARVMEDIRRITGYVDILYAIKNPAFLDMRKDRDYFVKTLLPWVFRYTATAPKISRLFEPVEAYLARRIASRRLRDTIAQHFFRGTPTFFALSYFRLYLDYHYPRGGTGALTEALARYLVDHDGEIVTESRVERLLPEQRLLVDQAGREYEYGEAIWAADAKRLYAACDERHLPSRRARAAVAAKRDEMREARGGDSALSVYLEVNLPPSYFAEIATGHVFYTPRADGLSTVGPEPPTLADVSRLPAQEIRERLVAWMHEYVDLNTFEIAIPALRDPELAPPGKTGLIVSLLFDYDVFAVAEAAGLYGEFKEACRERMINALDASLYPGLRDATEKAFAATPLTLARLTGNDSGAITGWAFTGDTMPAENRLPRIAAATKTPIPHVHQAGQWTYSPSGAPISILTGKLAADRALRG